MEQKTVRGRFAPSPSGRMHLGNIWSGLLAWLSARSAGGEMVLRLEDLDPDRCTRAWCDQVMRDLEWLGLTWDNEPVYQSERTQVYAEAFHALEEQGLIEYKMVFKLFCSLTHTSGKAGEEGAKITPGTYELNTDMDYRALISSMGSSSANRMTTTVTIPEGMTEAQIFSLLEEKGVSTVEQLEEAAANYDFKFSFLKGVVPLGDPKRLEGYLFPDTYEFYMGEEPVSVLNKMILRFDEIFTDEMRQEVQNDGRTIQDVVTVASMIEKETDGSDQAKIASVIYNRLNNPTSETAGYLNIDATILYATGGTEVDLNADTPYNTRTHKGLTPTAIASPGVDALKAAVYPDSTRYYFYALGDDGKHHFFATYREQQNFIASQERYQNG